MTSPARDKLASTEVVLVKCGDHVDHAAREHFFGSVGRPIHPSSTGPDVTIRAVELKRSRHEAHRLDEIVHGNSLERLDVLEDLLREKRFLLWCGLGDQRDEGDCQNALHDKFLL